MKLIIAISIPFAIIGMIGLAWSPIHNEQQHYLSLYEKGEEVAERYVLEEMTCNTLLNSVVLLDNQGYEGKESFYFINILFEEDHGYRYFLGLNERVEECK